jgi:hypothetical protein
MTRRSPEDRTFPIKKSLAPGESALEKTCPSLILGAADTMLPRLDGPEDAFQRKPILCLGGL